ncbi:restriction endonuclease subunit S [Liquorilactobacillus hordei]|uniref:Type I restriction enzyme specificity protein n=1 Tax=Liquorilactobacillus hordei DSM 19519 TaxID=1423759 RepID=A0A0R1MKV0_9LACO|nr:restriction endonuclease subunit S [Liquorilactobacillus hordei]KRL08121.1 type I restriction enzyme specificity protein [Liquorilactobacillus hordei DSM 19519]QYH51800.1 restriction endonuclease subunit S [Liquorilactobacillus hordei DSM 19519]
MSEKKQMVPKLRFPGFTDAWEQRKLGDLLKEFSIKSKIEDEHKVLSSTNSGMEFREGRVSGTSNLGYKIIKNGDLVLSPQNLWLGNININNIGKGLVSPSYKTFELINIDSSFINPQLRTQKMLEEYKNSSTQGASVVRRNLEIDSFYQIKIFVPTISEQEKIGSFFQQLDNTIVLHQRRLTHLKKLKSGLLQKIFPKNGEKFPKLRFPDFTDVWEQRKLGEVAEFSKGNGYTKEDLTENGSPIILYGRLYTKYKTVINDVDTFVVPKDRSVTSKGKEVIVPASGETAEDISRASVVGKSGFILGGDLNVIKPDVLIDSLFLALTISNGPQQKEMAKRAQGKSVVHLHSSDLQQINLLYPKLKEQRKIGAFFEQLEDAITLHQRKIDHLKLQKKALLQQMFV